MPGEQQEAGQRAFRLLATYLFGANQPRGSAPPARATPAAAGERIAMTAPVVQGRGPAIRGASTSGEASSSQHWQVHLVMPSGYVLERMPVPNDRQVVLRVLPPARFAVLRFSGRANPVSFEARTAELKALLAPHQAQAVGPASLAQYSPPSTPWFLRRNEVWIPVAR